MPAKLRKEAARRTPGKAEADAAKEHAFAEAYARLGEGAAACRELGIGGPTPEGQKVAASRMLQRPAVVERLRQIREAASEKGVATALERQELLTKILRGEVTETYTSFGQEFTRAPTIMERIKAAVELGKMQGDYIERHEVAHTHYVAALPPPVEDPAKWAKVVEAEVVNEKRRDG